MPRFGVLAETCAKKHDMGILMIAVGFMCPQGYFRQRISPEVAGKYHHRFSKAP
jgi:hypothetical protein